MENKSISIGKALAIIGGIWVLVFVLWKCNAWLDSGNTSTSTHNNLNATCYYYSQRLVKDKLKSPKSAEFPSYSSDFVTRSGDTVTVSAYVDADNSFGANVRVKYIATITLKDNEPVSGSATLIE